MIICFEGPSAIGKTTLAASLAGDVAVIPEVNLLFTRPAEAGPFWYYEKQVARYQRAKRSTFSAILDGDIFQPLWYNWIYRFSPQVLSFADLVAYYRDQVLRKQIAFPDCYFVFETDVAELRRRKAGDATRRRRHFEKHLQMIEPQRQYFQFLQHQTHIPVHFIQYKQVEGVRQQVLTSLKNLPIYPDKLIEDFETIVAWLQDRA